MSFLENIGVLTFFVILFVWSILLLQDNATLGPYHCKLPDGREIIFYLAKFDVPHVSVEQFDQLVEENDLLHARTWEYELFKHLVQRIPPHYYVLTMASSTAKYGSCKANESGILFPPLYLQNKEFPQLLKFDDVGLRRIQGLSFKVLLVSEVLLPEEVESVIQHYFS